MEGIPAIPKKPVAEPSLFVPGMMKSIDDIKRQTGVIWGRAQAGNIMVKNTQDTRLRLGEIFDIIPEQSAGQTFDVSSYDVGISLAEKLRNAPASRRGSISFEGIMPEAAETPRSTALQNITSNQAVRWAQENYNKMPESVQAAVDRLQAKPQAMVKAPENVAADPTLDGYYQAFRDRVESAKSVDMDMVDDLLIRQLESKDLPEEEVKMIQDILLKQDAGTPLTEQQMQYLENTFGDLSETTNEEILAAVTAGRREAEKAGADPKAIEDLKRLEHELSTEAAQGTAVTPDIEKQMREDRQKVMDYYTRTEINKPIPEAQRKVITERRKIASEGTKAQIYEAIDNSKLNDSERKDLKNLADYYYYVAERNPNVSVSEANNIVLQKLQGLNLPGKGVLEDIPRFLDRVGVDINMDTLNSMLIEDQAKASAFIRQEIKQKAKDPKAALKAWNAMEKELQSTALTGLEEVALRPAEKVSPWIKTTYLDTELRDAAREVRKIWNTPEHPLNYEITHYNPKTPWAFSPEVNSLMERVQAYEDVLAERLRSYTNNPDADLNQLLATNKVRTAIKMDQMLQQESFNTIGSPFEDGVRNLRLSFLDQIRGTHALDSHIMNIEAVKRADFFNALTAENMAKKVDIDTMSAEEITERVRSIYEDDLGRAGLDDESLLNDLSLINVTPDGQVDIPDSINRALGREPADVGTAEDILAKNLTVVEPTLPTEDMAQDVRIHKALTELFGEGSIDMSAPHIKAITAGKSFDPIFMRTYGKDAFIELANKHYVNEQQAFLAPAKIKRDLGVTKVAIKNYEAAALYDVYKKVDAYNMKRFDIFQKTRSDIVAAEGYSTKTSDELVKNAAMLIAIRRGTFVQQAILETIESGAVSKDTMRNLSNYMLDTSSPRAAYRSLEDVIIKEFEAGARNADTIYTGPNSASASAEFVANFKKETEFEEALIRQIKALNETIEERGITPALSQAKADALRRYAKAISDTAKTLRENRTSALKNRYEPDQIR